ncbi:MAG: hypothetical protein WCH01_05790 [Methylococcaceae bacterium]
MPRIFGTTRVTPNISPTSFASFLIQRLRLANLSLSRPFPQHYLALRDQFLKLRDTLPIDLQRPVVVTGSGARVGMQGIDFVELSCERHDNSSSMS